MAIHPFPLHSTFFDQIEDLAQLMEYRLHFLSHQLEDGQTLDTVGAMIRQNEALLTAVTCFKTGLLPATLQQLEQEISRTVRFPLAYLQSHLQWLVGVLGQSGQLLMIIQPIAKMARLASLLADYSLLQLPPAPKAETAVSLQPLLETAHAFDQNVVVKLSNEQELGVVQLDAPLFTQALSYLHWVLAKNTIPNHIKINAVRKPHHLQLTFVNPAVVLPFAAIARYKKCANNLDLLCDLKITSVEFSLAIAAKLFERVGVSMMIEPVFPAVITLTLPC